ncbi:uncharacterized protein METZ01_LOCUS394983, partial [marine metagenome]
VIDIRKIREDASGVKKALSKRGQKGLGKTIEELVALDEERRDSLAEVNTLKAKRNATSKQIGSMMKEGLSTDDIVTEMRELGDEVTILDTRIRELESKISDLLLIVPNIPHEEVPEGGIQNNQIIRTVGSPKQFDFDPKPH